MSRIFAGRPGSADPAVWVEGSPGATMVIVIDIPPTPLKSGRAFAASLRR